MNTHVALVNLLFGMQEGQSPLWIAACNDKLDVVSELLLAYADVNLADKVRVQISWCECLFV